MNLRMYIMCLMCALLFVSCESDYNRLVNDELKSGIVTDELVLGMKMGQTQKDFFAICWELNKQQKISQGSGNNYAKYVIIPDSSADMTKKVEMLFYGMFDRNKVMYGMDMKMSFVAWAPWNEDYHSDQLLSFIQKKYMDDYGGNEFIQIDIKDHIQAFVKVDGNRQIVMYPLNNKDIAVKIEDLNDEKYNKSKNGTKNI